jgi:1-aminocyclopropane-1-carboxylate deaminase
VKARTDAIDLPELRDSGVSLYLRREDLLYPQLSGNKYRKLRYNLEEARKLGYRRLITFGGAYSNHIHATAAAGQIYGFETLGLIRGDELEGRPLNPTLEDARRGGMRLVFLSREDYARRGDPEFQACCLERFGPGYLLPEGGTNDLAVQGCAEILQPEDTRFDLICCPVGTGGTLAGLLRGAALHQRVLGYPALKAEGLSAQLASWIPGDRWALSDHSHGGGYGRITADLVAFINEFREQAGIALDPVYTGKMMHAILDDIRNGRIPPGSNVLAIHTGGLQGIRGMNRQLRKKNLPLLQL